MLLTGCNLCLLQATDLAKLLSAAATRIQNLQNENKESGALDMKSIWYSLTDSKMRTQSLEVSACAWHPEAFRLLHCVARQVDSRTRLRKAEVSSCASHPKAMRPCCIISRTGGHQAMTWSADFEVLSKCYVICWSGGTC